MSKKTGFLPFLKESIPGTIWAIGISSLLVNMATSVCFSGGALYLKTVLGVSTLTIGLIEAPTEAISYGVRVFSGVISDYFRKRKTLVVIGFIMITIAKPFLALSKTPMEVLAVKALDRIGNGIQATPRDALVSDSAPKEIKGACFGLRQSLSVIGSALGGILGVIVMLASHNNFELVFFLAAIPAAIATFILIYFVKEQKHKHEEKRKIKLSDAKLLGKKFWILMIVVAIFMLGRFSEVFISLHACGNFGLDIGYGTAITVVFNIIATFVAYPVGKMSDKMDRTTLLVVGFILLFVSHIILGFPLNLYMIGLGTITWGMQIGITQSIFLTLVSDYIPKDLRGTGYGVYYFMVAISTAIATVLAGLISHNYGEAYAFKMGAVFCSVAIITLLYFKKALKVART